MTDPERDSLLLNMQASVEYLIARVKELQESHDRHYALLLALGKRMERVEAKADLAIPKVN